MNLNKYMKQNVKRVSTVEYTPSDAILGEDGKPDVWILRPLSNKEVDKIQDNAMVEYYDPKSGMKVSESLNKKKFLEDLILASMVQPSRVDFENSEVQDSWGALSPQEVLKAMLDPGEYGDLADKVQEICGYDPIKFDELVEVAKKK